MSLTAVSDLLDDEYDRIAWEVAYDNGNLCAVWNENESDVVDDTTASSPSTTQRVLSLVLDCVPFVGTAKSGIELVTGRDAVTGEEVSRWGALLGVIPVGKLASRAYKAIRGGTHVVGKDVLHAVVDSLQLPAKYAGDAAKAEHLRRKQVALRKAIDAGEVTLEKILEGSSHVRKEATAYRELIKQRIGKIADPLRREQLLQRLETRQVDHSLELQWGGKDVRQNLKLLDSAVNQSVGRQLQNAKGELVQQLTKAAAHEQQLGSIVQHSASSINGALSHAVRSKSELESALAAAFDADDTAGMERIRDELLHIERPDAAERLERERAAAFDNRDTGRSIIAEESIPQADDSAAIRRREQERAAEQQQRERQQQQQQLDRMKTITAHRRDDY